MKRSCGVAQLTVAEAILLDALDNGPTTLSDIAAKHGDVCRRTLEAVARLFIASGLVEHAGLRHVFSTGRRARLLRLSRRGREAARTYRGSAFRRAS